MTNRLLLVGAKEWKHFLNFQQLNFLMMLAIRFLAWQTNLKSLKIIDIGHQLHFLHFTRSLPFYRLLAFVWNQRFVIILIRGHQSVNISKHWWHNFFVVHGDWNYMCSILCTGNMSSITLFATFRWCYFVRLLPESGRSAEEFYSNAR